MNPGVSTWSLLKSNLDSALVTLGDSGVDYVELWGEVPHAYHDWVDKRRLKDVLSTYGFTVAMHAPFTDLNPATPFEPVKGAVTKTLKSFIKFAAELDAVRVTFHPGGVHSGALVPQSMKDAVDLMNELVDEAGGSLDINVENQVRSSSPYSFPLGSDAESIETLLSSVDGLLYTLDTGHAHASGIDPIVLFERFRDKITEIHLSDNGGKADEHLQPGHGSAKLRELFDNLQGRDAFVCLEMNPFHYSEEEVVAAAQKLRNGTLV